MPRQYTVIHHVTEQRWYPYWRDKDGEEWQQCCGTPFGHPISHLTRKEALEWVRYYERTGETTYQHSIPGQSVSSTESSR